MTTSETTETQRDLHADLAICSAATAGPWKARGWTVPTADQYNVGSTYDDSELFTAWQGVRYPGGPEVSAEQARLNAIFAAEARTGWPIAIERAISAEAENEMLRSTIMTVFQRARNDVNRREGGVCFGTTTFHDYPFAKRLVRDFEPIIFPEVAANE